MNKNEKIVVISFNPKIKIKEFEENIIKTDYYKKFNTHIKLLENQKVLIYIPLNENKIKYLMEVVKIYKDSVDLKLVHKLTKNESNLLTYEKLIENGLLPGTGNFILNNNKRLYKYITSVLNNELPQINESKNMKTKNIMLYGAPGVGKTHNYKRLITMIENGNDEKTIFDTISKNEMTIGFNDSVFKTIKNEKRIEFVTFHQSYSYEDFIEGFRPNENGKLELEDGIFKNIVNSALGKIKINEVFSINREIVSERSSYVVETITNDLINVKKDKDNKIVPIPKKLFLELLENINKGVILLEDIKNRNLDNLETKFDKYMYGYNSILYTLCKNVIENIKHEEQKNFYIVIDEINRGNISKIFGELITLIEEDKRDEYEVTLPYSKEKFKIPSNLYIIATMNSTDKSIATIDIALRRRFTFLKMKPKLELVKYEKANKLMDDLNKHISKAISEDYMLGHSYFMNIENEKDLELVKEYKIKPLLEEYFYGDEDNYNKAINILGIEENE